METTNNQPILAMEVGTYVRMKGLDADNPMYNGKIGRISTVPVEGGGRVWVKFQDQCYNVYNPREFFLSPDNLEVVADQDKAPHEQQLEAWLARYEYQEKQVKKFEKEFDDLCDAAIQVAQDRGFCGDYDSVVDDINDDMSRRGNSLRLRKREREYHVSVDIRATIWASTTVTVTATSEDEAHEIVESELGELTDVFEVLQEEISMNGCDYEVDHIEVQ